MLAIGLNLRDDRPCGRLREYESRVPPFVLAVGWAALLGTFVGLVSPFWRSESFIAEAEAAIRIIALPTSIAPTRPISNAIAADRLLCPALARIGSVALDGLAAERGKVDDKTTRWSWKTIPLSVRDGRAASAQPQRTGACTASVPRSIHQMLSLIGSKLEPLEAIRLRGEMVKSTRTATLLNPTSAELHARLAHASAEINMYQDAVDEANEALRLDRLTPHRDRKLPETVRERLEAMIPTWEENAAKMPIPTNHDGDRRKCRGGRRCVPLECGSLRPL